MAAITLNAENFERTISENELVLVDSLLAGDAFCDVAADARQRLGATLDTVGGDR